MQTLESIVAGGLTGEGVDDTELPVVETDADDMQGALLEGQDTCASVESFLQWARFTEQHVSVLRRVSAESLARTVEGDTMKKIGTGIKEAAKHIWTSFKNFVMRIVNFFRTIGMKDKCAEITKLGSSININELDTKYANKKFGDPKLLLGVENLFRANLRKGIDGSVGTATEGTPIGDWMKENGEALSKDSIAPSVAVKEYVGSHLEKSYDFFTKDFEKLLGHLNRFMRVVVDADTDDRKLGDAQKRTLGEIRAMYSMSLKAYSKWIKLTSFVYKLCKGGNSDNATGDEKPKSEPA